MNAIVTKCSGHYEFYKNDEFMGESDNVITDSFISRFANIQTNTSYAFCVVGSGNTTPDVTDITLETPITDGVNGYKNYDEIYRYVDVSDYVSSIVYTFNFTQGAFTGNVREVGVRFHNATSGITSASSIDSRVLVRDGSGNPTTIVITSSDSLTVVFKYRTVIDAQATTLINMDGTDYTITYELLNLNAWYPAIHWSDSKYGGVATALIVNSRSLVNNPLSTAVATGTSVACTDTLTLVGTDSVDCQLDIPIGATDLNNGVEYIQLNGTSLRYGLHFSPALSAGSAKTLQLVLRHQLISVAPPVTPTPTPTTTVTPTPTTTVTPTPTTTVTPSTSGV